MFDNIGGKIKMLAKVLCWIGIIGSVITGFSLMAFLSRGIGFLGVLLGLLVAGVGCLFAWIGSFFTYGFGQLIENTDRIKSL